MNEILAKLQEIAASVGGSSEPAGTGAIDAILHEPRRTTAVQSLRDSDAWREFERAIIDGEIKQDAVLQILNIVQTVISIASKF